jgi:hypothetical protein
MRTVEVDSVQHVGVILIFLQIRPFYIFLIKLKYILIMWRPESHVCSCFLQQNRYIIKTFIRWLRIGVHLSHPESSVQ